MTVGQPLCWHGPECSGTGPECAPDNQHLRHRVAVAIHGGKHHPDFVPASHYYQTADAVLDALGLVHVGGLVRLVDGRHQRPGEPLYRLDGKSEPEGLAPCLPADADPSGDHHIDAEGFCPHGIPAGVGCLVCEVLLTVEREGDAMSKVEKIRNIIEGLPEGYELYAAVGALVSIADVLDQDDDGDD